MNSSREGIQVCHSITKLGIPYRIQLKDDHETSAFWYTPPKLPLAVDSETPERGRARKKGQSGQKYIL